MSKNKEPSYVQEVDSNGKIEMVPANRKAFRIYNKQNSTREERLADIRAVKKFIKGLFKGSKK